MKGIVFTEFLEMVEEKFSLEMVDTIIESSDLNSGGAYTAIGTYDHSEIFALIGQLHKSTDIPIPDLMMVFGEHLFARFAVAYPHFFERPSDAFTFLESIHNYIHKEVQKLYPDAQLPAFKTEREGDRTLKMLYESERRMGPFAHGLIIGCLKFFNENADIVSEQLDETGSTVMFTITKS